MTYEEAVSFLYSSTPQFQSIGAAAYKPGLQTVTALASAFGNPQDSYHVIHVGGTNGKGSTSHTLAAVLQEAGYKVGLYTSPHLVDFRERIRVNGRMIPREEVARFVSCFCGSELSDSLSPSFFELTTVMAFEWFRRAGVDVAVIEVGLGGRLDSTNIVHSDLSVITNISFDHMAQLGNTLESIASEKAGIMRSGVPVVIGERNEGIRDFLISKAKECGAVPHIAQDMHPSACFSNNTDGTMGISVHGFPELSFQLAGDCQRENALTILTAVRELRSLGWGITDDALKTGFANVCDLTGLMGRWMKVSESPLVICDTGHNIGGWAHLAPQIDRLPRPLTIVLGFVNDKDTSHIFPLLPQDACIIYTNAAIPRAMPAEELGRLGEKASRPGRVVAGVPDAYKAALDTSPASVFVGGSTFVVADFLASLGSRCKTDK